MSIGAMKPMVVDRALEENDERVDGAIRGREGSMAGEQETVDIAEW